MRTLLEDTEGNPIVEFDETTNTCYFLKKGKVYPMKWVPSIVSYEFDETAPDDIKYEQERLNDRIYGVLHN